MFERFTETAIKVIMLAQDESRRLGHNFVDSEQILLGLIREETGNAGQILRSYGITLNKVRIEVENIIGRGDDTIGVEIPFAPGAKHLLESSWEEAKLLGSDNIGTEHLLLGLTKAKDGVAISVLNKLKIDTDKVQKQVVELIPKSTKINKIPDGSISKTKYLAAPQNPSDKYAGSLFAKFTEKAIKVVMLAQEEARRLGHNFVGAEQILLGLIGEGTGIAAKQLNKVGVNLKDAREETEKIIGRGSGFTAAEMPFIHSGKQAVELAFEEAKQLGHNYVGTEHLLLAIIREQEGVAIRVLNTLNVDLNTLRDDTIKLISPTAESKDIIDKEESIINSPYALIVQFVRVLAPEALDQAHQLENVIRDKAAAIQNQEFNKAAGLKSKENKLSEELQKLTSSSLELYTPILIDKYTDSALGTIKLARREARLLNHSLIDVEHLLLALIADNSGISGKIFQSKSIILTNAQTEILKLIGQGSPPVPVLIPFTVQTRKVLMSAHAESKLMGHNYIGTEHLLLGLLKEGKGTSHTALEKLGIDIAMMKEELIKLASSQAPN